MQFPEKYYNANVTGTLKLLQSMVRNKVPKGIIYTASSSCYGIRDNFPTDENADERPQYPYALTKLLGEKIIFHWSQIYGSKQSLLDYLMSTELDLGLKDLWCNVWCFFGTKISK